ncbi:hypothetical protein GCM10028818_49400 [Spirosoma horti]
MRDRRGGLWSTYGPAIYLFCPGSPRHFGAGSGGIGLKISHLNKYYTYTTSETETKENPWQLKTLSGTSDYTMYKAEKDAVDRKPCGRLVWLKERIAWALWHVPSTPTGSFGFGRSRT